MKPTKNLAYRVGGDYEDHKVIRVRQMNGLKGRLNDYKQHRYIRADIVENLIEEIKDLWEWEIGYDVDSEENQEIYGDHPLIQAIKEIEL